jgi:hypothetical protein
MRFAYIDSQGNEVPIPSVDALALRIELGAIGPDTQLYDAQADRWGPASSHEIFHTLFRDSAEEGFVAPPPPVVSEEPAEPARSAGRARSSEPSEPAAKPAPAPEGTKPAEPREVTPPEPREAPPVFDLSDEFLARSVEPGTGGAQGAADEGTKEGSESAGDSSAARSDATRSEPMATGTDDLGLDLTFTDAGSPPAGADRPTAAGGPPKAPESPEAGEAFSLGGFDVLEGPPPGKSEEGGGSGLGEPLSDLTLESPTAWMARGGDEDRDREADDGSMRFDSGRAEPPEEGERKTGRTPPPRPERPSRERPTPRNRPSPPRRVKKHSLLGALARLVVVAAVAAGGWYGWQWYQGRAERERAAQLAAVQAEVTLPEIPAGLLPRMRDLGNAALSATITRLGDMEGSFRLGTEPDSEWLAGIYMANASRYGGIRTYWEGIRDFVDTVRAVDAKVFHEEYVKQLQHAGFKGDTARMLLARADSGFAATRKDRQAAYSLMDDLVNASLNLHQFLLANQSQIDYEPAAGGVSRDPVLEAVPKNKQLGTEMWSRVDQITAALDSLGTLDKVTTEQLTRTLLERIRKAGFR